MKIRAAVLTTFNRPALLRQSLEPVIAQCQQAGLPLWIFDDASTDHDTLEMLERAKNAESVRVFLRPERDNLHAHLSTGRLFVRAVAELLKAFGDGAFLKLDDDIVLTDDAITRLLNGWAHLWRLGQAPAALSGLATPHTKRLGGSTSSALCGRIEATETSSSVACVHRLDLWHECIRELGAARIVKTGWDTAFFHLWLNRQPELNRCFTLCPSVVYHTGHTGVHLLDTDHNCQPPDPFAFPGEWEDGKPKGVVTQTGKLDTWLSIYGERTEVPADG